MAFPSNYDKFPTIKVPGAEAQIGWAEVLKNLQLQAEQHVQPPRIVIDTYPGTDLTELKVAAAQQLPGYALVNAEEAALDTEVLERLLSRFLTDDRVFGAVSPHQLTEFYDPGHLETLRSQLAEVTQPTLVFGWGAALVVTNPTLLVVADLARWEIQRRLRGGMGNWHADNASDDILRKYKRGFFVEWRVADRHKLGLFSRMDFYLDTNAVGRPVLIDRLTFGQSLDQAVSRPYRLVPFFDPGVWGGQWMKQICGLPPEVPNYAWCFDGVPEENSLRFDYVDYGGTLLEMPAQNLTLLRPTELLGERTHARFGAEFPIRFDLLDTMQGGNLSLQVHPLTSYIQQHFGMAYTQDESYYLLDAGEDAVVYLGLKTDTDREALLSDLADSQTTGQFDAERHVNAVPAHKHDHFSIPAGTIHCSGKNSMVLEISATPFIFTFKLWDWGRLGLDGLPRPVHLELGKANICWERDTAWVEDQLLNQTETLGSGEGWREERTGLSELEFIETRRHWFSVPVRHDTQGTVNVLNLVEGQAAVVESPGGAFEPFVVHYAETFIVPAQVGEYVIRPARAGEQIATIKAFVRGTGRT